MHRLLVILEGFEPTNLVPRNGLVVLQRQYQVDRVMIARRPESELLWQAMPTIRTGRNKCLRLGPWEQAPR